MAGSSGCVVAGLRYLSRRKWNNSRMIRVESDQQEINGTVYDSIEVGERVGDKKREKRGKVG